MNTTRNGVWIRTLLVVIFLLLIGLIVALAIVIPQFLHAQVVQYGAIVVLPEQAEYCPGDSLRFTYTLRMDRPGPVEIVRAWCRQHDGTCLLSESTVYYGVITAKRQARNISASRPIPSSSLFVPGEVWEYAQSVQSLDGGRAETFSVPFRIAGGCP